MAISPLILTTFCSILLLNLIGLIPYSFTVTSSISVTFYLAFAFNFGFLVLGISIAWFFLSFKLFLPSGVPLFVSKAINFFN